MADLKLKINARRFSSPYRSINNDLNIQLFLHNAHRSTNRKNSNKPSSHSKQHDYSQDKIKNQYQLQCIIGVGGFGRVWKVIHKQQVFAMKEINKALVLLKQSVPSIMTELKFLTELKHPFIVNAYSAFQDTQNLYLVLDYLSGGDLRFHLGKQRKFSEEQTKFFVACITIALEYLHSQKIIHRDIKPENLIFDNHGYLRITDLGVAIKKHAQFPQNFETSGTPGYMSPEVLFRQDHGIPADYFALGVICYECMTGRRPYHGTRKDIREQMLLKQVQVNMSDWSPEANDFINQLLLIKPQQRLTQPRTHPWFKNYPFDLLASKKLQAPYLPVRKDNFDKAQILIEDEENHQIIKLNQHLIKDNQHLFDDYRCQINEKSRRSSITNKMFFQLF
ncbi:unnamed protein product (macronuclear) [Paramecium tetraurelia]|uniref:non-specific serine/threonine protein kinase n=1 Tax=Paramecium tetraurelia TaxID=5888 RepID=A0E9N3_PARTE|nr:uncharacterized protein GSPATT00024731001 [Paramecium tetraurelia]CAK92000.1 unnamed protein product [Paramecium tetraurelia]|eukprot:XP_001459397.1 hypothetical protein (macronuclear) [Paramecium tetraurelia strain d4-2]